MQKYQDKNNLKQGIFFANLPLQKFRKGKLSSNETTIDIDSKYNSVNTSILNTGKLQSPHSKSISISQRKNSLDQSRSLPKLRHITSLSIKNQSQDEVEERPSIQIQLFPTLNNNIKRKKNIRLANHDIQRRNGVKSLSKIKIQVHNFRNKSMKKWRGYNDYMFLRDRESVFYTLDKDISDKFGYKLDHRQRTIHYSQVTTNIRKRDLMEKIIADLQQVILLQKDDQIEQVDELFSSEIILDLKHYRVGNLVMIGIMTLCMLLENYGMWKQAQIAWKKLVNYCNSYRVYKYKVVAYKYLTKNYCHLKQYDHALNYVKKLLKYAWYYDLSEYEIECYDQIALIYYYQRSMEFARGFHERFMSGEGVPKNNIFRQANEQITQFEIIHKDDRSDMNSSSEEEMNLHQIVTQLHKPKEDEEAEQAQKLQFMSLFDQAIQQKKNIMKILINYSKDNKSYSKAKINDYLKKITQPLGPFVQRSALYDEGLVDHNIQFFTTEQYQQLSLNRDQREFIIARENLNKYTYDNSFIYRPQEGKQVASSLVQLLIQDIEEFHKYGFFAGID